jgi:hypothetical protein
MEARRKTIFMRARQQLLGLATLSKASPREIGWLRKLGYSA